MAQLQTLVSPGDGPQVPLMLWLHGTPDDRAAALRKRGIEGFADAILEAGGGDATPERRLRAELVLALGAGIATLRAPVDLQPLASVSADDLIGPLGDAVTALPGPMPSRDRPSG